MKITDAQVNAALSALRGKNYHAWKEITPDAMRASLEAATASISEPVYEYACFTHSVIGRWELNPEKHREICPHVVRRTVAGEWEEDYS